ncbi:Periplasmic beta-glucosidase precursor [Hartmannibacter diazotrophicus]|uniref:beta-glucosidase n=1 Tax=Hartmannibacter diazotrophicus TaxID=1482074 RepID=A0A2C9D6I2_9HYPH|nr:beta-glucosidase BglX [Hartmannibacter diazotrophicus]SON55934.1 Periplasmic beta-glucosidase precursor [Hartmannibacter diazotrophicus]
MMRIDDLIAQMTLEEKIGQLNLATPGGETLTGAVANQDVARKVLEGSIGSIFGVKSLATMRAFQDLAMRTRLKIPLMFAEDVIHGYRTVFPVPLGLAASFDMDLVEKTARVAAVEAAVMGIDQTYAPMIDIGRDPRWGRVAECPGEDPYLAARLAEAQVRGFQGNDLTSPDAVMACLKHFVGYGAAEGGRDYDSADMSPARLHDVYLASFKAGVAAGAGSVMAAFNTLNGIPMHANRTLIRDVLQKGYGFDGLVVADYTGIMELVPHGVAEDLAAAAVLGIEAGVDFDMVSEAYVSHLADAVAEERIDVALIDEACRRVLEAKEKLGLFDDPYRRMAGDPDKVLLAPGHRELARRAVAESCVLLQNEAAVLPLAEGSRIALIGPLADDLVNMNGTWAVSGLAKDAVTVRSAMEARCDLSFARGTNITDDPALADRLNVHDRGTPSASIDQRSPKELIAEATAVAAKADAIVAVLGESKEYSGESSSRVDLRLSAGQIALLKALRSLGKPLVAVVLTGRPLVLTDVADLCDALLIGWFGGTETGNGLADVLFGTADPGGRLPATFPWAEGQVPLTYAHLPTGRPFTGKFEKFRTGYLDIPDGQPHNDGLFGFGAGLSYTTFDFTHPAVERSALKSTEDRLRVSVEVENTGARSGSTVVQLYVSDPVASRSRPVRELKGFEKVRLEPHTRTTVHFELSADDLSFSTAETVTDLSWTFEPGKFILSTGPNSRDLQHIDIDWQA